MTVDIIILLVLVVFILSGYRKGLILSMCSLLVLVISCLGASVAQRTLTPRVVAQLEPQVTEIIAEQMDTQIAASVDNAITDAGSIGITIGGQAVTLNDLIDLLGRFGFDVSTTAQNTATDLSTPVVEAIAASLAATLLDALAGIFIFLAAFLIIYLLLRAVELGINMVDHVPVIHTLNHLGGGLVGFISGLFLLIMIQALLTRTNLASETLLDGPLSGLLGQIAARFT